MKEKNNISTLNSSEVQKEEKLNINKSTGQNKLSQEEGPALTLASPP